MWTTKGPTHTYTGIRSHSNPLPSRLTHIIEQSPLHCTGGPCWLPILNMTVCMSIPSFLSIPSPIFCSVPTLVPDTDRYKCTLLGIQIPTIINPVFSHNVCAAMMGTVRVFPKPLSITYMENSLDFLKRYL